MKRLLSPWMALFTMVLLIVIRLSDPGFVESTRLRYFDQLLTLKESTVSKQVHVVNIDDEFIKEKGQFPFPRGQYAKIINDLYNRNAGLVVFNVYMPDDDRFNQDDILAKVLQKYNVVLPHVASNENYSNSYLPFRPGVSVIGGDTTIGIKYDIIEPNVKILNNSAAGIGVVNTFPEIDGVTRRIPMVINSKGQLYPSISLETLRVAAGDPSFQVKAESGRIKAIRIPKFGKIDTDEYGRIWIDPTTRPIEHSLNKLPKDFNNEFVIVGLTAKGITNPVASSNGSVYPHYLQATVIDTLLNGNNISRPDWIFSVELVFIIILSILIIIFTRWKYAIAPIIILIGSLHYVSLHVFDSYGILVDGMYGIICLFFIFTHAYVVKFVSELNQKQQIKKQFGTYLSPAMVEKLQRNPELLVLGGQTRELSIMFTDVRGFTTISEHYGEDVQGLVKIMNRYMTAMTGKIIENGGTLDKYIGDAQMAFWNAPLDNPNHAYESVKTALQMMVSLDEFNKEITAEGIPAFGMGLGINTGNVVVGNMGSSQRFDYTCLGDSVNLASRLEGQSKNYGVRIILGPETAYQVKDQYTIVELDCIAVKGKSVGVKIFTVADHTSSHYEYLKVYYSGDWVKAKRICNVLSQQNGELKLYYELMLERLNKGLPDNWSGVYISTSK